MIFQHHDLLVDEINASRITNTLKCINASMHQASIFCYKVVHIQEIVGIANLIYQICKDNKANKHGEKNLQRPQFYFHLNNF